MKKYCLKKRAVALALSAVTACSVAVTSMSTVGAAETNTSVGFDAEDAAKASFETAFKVGIAAFSEYGPEPYSKLLGPVFETVLGICSDEIFGEKEQAPTLLDVQEDIKQLRDHIDEGIRQIEENLDEKTTIVLNRMADTAVATNLGDELDNLHTSLETFADQINSTMANEKMTVDEKAISIASRIGSDDQWGNPDNFLFRIMKIANLLAGGSYVDLKTSELSRDMYHVLYDYYTSESMFSGEAYNKAMPYINRVMLEYLYAYSIAVQCLDASKTVYQISIDKTRRDKIQEKSEVLYSRLLSCASVDYNIINNALKNLNNKMFNAKDEHSVISHYTVFAHKAKNDKNVFIDHGQCEIPIALKSHELSDYGFHYREENIKNICESNYAAAKNELEQIISDSVITPAQITELGQYLFEKKSGISMADFLNEMGIDASLIHNYGLDDVKEFGWTPETSYQYVDTFFPAKSELIENTYKPYDADSKAYELGYYSINPEKTDTIQTQNFYNYEYVTPDNNSDDMFEWIESIFKKSHTYYSSHTDKSVKILTFRQTERNFTQKTALDCLDAPLLGDVDLDGKVTITDVSLLQLYAAKGTELHDINQILNADVNQDGEINIADATALQMICARSK